MRASSRRSARRVHESHRALVRLAYPLSAFKSSRNTRAVVVHYKYKIQSRLLYLDTAQQNTNLITLIFLLKKKNIVCVRRIMDYVTASRDAAHVAGQGSVDNKGNVSQQNEDGVSSSGPRGPRVQNHSAFMADSDSLPPLGPHHRLAVFLTAVLLAGGYVAAFSAVAGCV